MSGKFTISATMAASPREVYDAWLDSRAHSAMTGAKAKASAKVGGRFSAWDGYASGENLELVAGKRIVQSWRTTDFAGSDPDSRLAVRLTPVAGGTRVALTHSGIPPGESGYRDGWREFCLAPMKAYFARRKRS